MASLISSVEQASILATFEASFDTWSRAITVFKEATKTEASPIPSTTSNLFGFGEAQQEASYTYSAALSQVFQGVIRDGDIAVASAQAKGMMLSPEILARILASPISLKVRKDCSDFIENGPTERIVDNKTGEVYLLNGHRCLQTYQGSEYYVYPLRKTQ
jgi:hypothetical protein